MAVHFTEIYAWSRLNGYEFDWWELQVIDELDMLRREAEVNPKDRELELE